MFCEILKHKLVSILSLASLCFVLGGFFWAYFDLRNAGSGPFIIHFNDVNGITSVGGLGTIVFMGIFGIVVVLMNSWIALEFEMKEAFFGKLLAALTLVLAVLLFVGFASIMAVN